MSDHAHVQTAHQNDVHREKPTPRPSRQKPMVAVCVIGCVSALIAAVLQQWTYAGTLLGATLLTIKFVVDRAVAESDPGLRRTLTDRGLDLPVLHRPDADSGTGDLAELVGVRGFEPPAPASRTQCSTRLSYTPTEARHIDA